MLREAKHSRSRRTPCPLPTARTRQGVPTTSTAPWELPHTPISAQAGKRSFDSVSWFPPTHCALMLQGAPVNAVGHADVKCSRAAADNVDEILVILHGN